MISEDQRNLVFALLAVLVFMTGFVLGLLCLKGKFRRSLSSVHGDKLSKKCIKWIFIFVLVFKAVGLFLAFNSTVGSTVLEASLDTQNQGAAYLYRIPIVGTILYLFLLTVAYRDKAAIWESVVCTLVLVAEAIVTTTRTGLIMIIFWNVFLFHIFVRPIRIWYVALFAPPLILILVIFGYARNIGLGSLAAYSEGLQVVVQNPNLFVELFMSRMDMLPQIVAGVILHGQSIAPDLYGGSYVYAFSHAIPRSIWSEKPPLTAALLTSITNPNEFAEGVLIFPSVVVEALFNFGWLWVFIVGNIFGWLSTYYDKLTDPRSLTKFVWALFFLSFPMGLFNEGIHSNYFANLLYFSMMYLAVVLTLSASKGLQKNHVYIHDNAIH